MLRLSQISNHLLFWGNTSKNSFHSVEQHSTSSKNSNDNEESNPRSYPIPQLITLDAMVSEIKRIVPPDFDFSKVVIVGVQHNLETTVTLYKALQQLGIKKIYTLGKCYSDSPPIIQVMKDSGIELIPSSTPRRPGQYHEAARIDIANLWKKAISGIKKDDIIIVLDDGGRALAGTPPNIRLGDNRIAGVEQTRSGLYIDEIGRLLFPVIEAASSAIKKLIEPAFIAKAVLRKVNNILANYKISKDTVIGVIGNGAIGGAIAEYLLELGYRVAIYDEDESAFSKIKTHQRFYRMESVKDLIANSQCVFSCTGKDVTQGLSLSGIVTKDTLFVSCTSEDKEFLSALKTISHENVIIPDPLSNITVVSKNGSQIVFARGGCPINFDGQPWNVPANEIEPTQTVLFNSIIQAIFSAKKAVGDGVTPNRHERLMLSPELQRFAIEQWRVTPAAKQYSESTLDCFRDLEWIRKNSGGEYRENAIFKKISLVKDDVVLLAASPPLLRSRF